VGARGAEWYLNQLASRSCWFYWQFSFTLQQNHCAILELPKLGMDPPSLTDLSCLENFRIKSVPANAFYISDFITEDEERVLLSKVCAFRYFNVRLQVLTLERSRQRQNLDGSNYQNEGFKHGHPI
jgi:hypothetical protein